MAKLTDDPRVAALVEKTRTAATAAAVRESVKVIREHAQAHGEDAKQSGNPDAARRIKALGGDQIAAVRRLSVADAAAA